MQQPTNAIFARFTFKPDRAHEFTDDGREIIELVLEEIEEVQEYCEQFKEALLDVNAIVNGTVVNLSDFTYEI